MKKRSLWILALSALLCLSILFSACSPAESEGEPKESESEEDTVAETEEVVPQDEVVDYKAILGEWSKYLKFVGLEDKGDIYTTSIPLFEDLYSDDVDVSVNIHGNVVEVVKVKEARLDTATGDVLLPGNRTTSYYDLTTGELIITKSQGVWDSTSFDGFLNDYRSTVLFDTIIAVEEYTWSNKGDILIPNWVKDSTYSYYLSDGTVIAEGLKESAEIHSDAYVKAVEINGTVYYCRDGKIVYQDVNGSAYPIPEFTMEYGEYKYNVTYETLQVIDDQYELVVEYTIPSYLKRSNCKYFILENGSVYFYGVEGCYGNEEHYDYKDTEGNKYRVWHVIVDLDGKETVVDAPFILSDRSSIGGLASKFDTENTGIDFLGNYQYAEIVRIDNGYLANDVEFVILDNKLDEVAALPKILKNQVAVENGLGQGKLMVVVDNIMNTDAKYVVDTEDGSVVRFFNPDVDYSAFKNGLIFEGQVYDYSLNQVADIGAGIYGINGNAVYYSDYVYSPDTETDTEGEEYTTEAEEESESESEEDDYVYYSAKYVGYVDENGDFVSNKLGDNVRVEYDSCGLYTVKSYGGYTQLYNRYGERIHLRSEGTVAGIKIISSVDGYAVVRATQLNEVGYIVGYTYYIVK